MDTSFLDNCISNLDVFLRTVLPPETRFALRDNPSKNMEEAPLTSGEKKHSAGLMRVNHSGEVCAQALYMGQAQAAVSPAIKEEMQKAAEEETDHLAWCESRLRELNASPSILNPIWYVQSYLLGYFAGKCSDNVSLGFVAETERQVGRHLEKHLRKLPENDAPSRAIISQMQEDEAKHEAWAREAGGVKLPFFVRMLMGGVSKVMTTLSYYR